jgi:hypothetical protein
MKLIPLFEESTDIKSQVIAAKKAYDTEEESLHDDKNGNPFSTCTYGAKWLKEKFFPKAEIRGYHIDDNPTAEIGQDEGGHDFLLVGGKYIVDFWYHNMYDNNAPILLDIGKDKKLVEKYYGDKNTWEEVKI